MGAIRLFLALVVAVDHLRLIILHPLGIDTLEYWKLGMNAGFAVMFFYVISGFLMSLVLGGKYEPTAAGTLRFYQNRFVRIFSLYWPIVALIFICLPSARDEFIASSLADKLTNLFIFGADWRIAFADYPAFHWAATPTALHQAWTLAPELTFYALAPFLLRSWKAVLIFLFLSVGTRAVLVGMVGFRESWTYFFLPSTFLFFILGHLARSVSRRWPLINDWKVGVILVAGCLSCLLVGSYATWDRPRFWIAVLCFAAALPSIFEASRRSKLLNTLGDLSFPVYLVHVVMMLTLADVGFFAMLPISAPIITLSFLAATLVGAAAAHWLLERPTAALLHAIIRCGSRRVPIPGAAGAPPVSFGPEAPPISSTLPPSPRGTS
jgi:peptidoglycan/LPS O-acetylase OafA/YrhL